MARGETANDDVGGGSADGGGRPTFAARRERQDGGASGAASDQKRRRHQSKHERRAAKRHKKTTATTTTNGRAADPSPTTERAEAPSSGTSSASSPRSDAQSSSRSKDASESRRGRGGGDAEDSNGGGGGIDEEERIRSRCLESYTPVGLPRQLPPPDVAAAAADAAADGRNEVAADDEGGCRTLGRWFPTAILVKCSINYTNTGRLVLLKDGDGEGGPALTEGGVRVDNPTSSLVLFYQYTTCGSSPPWDRQRLQAVTAYLALVARKRHLGGRIRVAPEGINATVSAVDLPGATAQAALRHFAEDLRRVLDARVFARTDFKYVDNLPPDRHFKELKILPVRELVFYDIGEGEAPLDAEDVDEEEDSGRATGDKLCGGHHTRGGVHLDAKEYHEMLQRDNTVVIDVRNHYETILGRFDGQQQQKQQKRPPAAEIGKAANTGKKEDRPAPAPSSTPAGGAEYIDPLMRKSTDFKSWLAAGETREKLKDKTVLMYCTGGIRCERASAYLKKEMGDQVQGVYQLKGGIERYLKTFRDGGFWRGKNFVFDKREAVGVDNPEGDGGVIRKQDKKRERNQNGGNRGGVPAKCCVCGDPWDRYVGKKKCSTCGVPVLMCDKCMSQRPDKTPGMELKVRCPLCVAENITVLASEVEFTANGIKGKVKADSSKSSRKGKTEDETKATGRAAESVLKWGGGHANEKKQLKKMKRRLCQFGADCVRQDCFFSHPERNSGGALAE